MALNLGPLNVLLRLQGADKFRRDTKQAAGGLDLIGKASVAATAALATAGYQALQATRTFAEFEKGMTRVGAVTNSLGTTAFAGLTDRAQQLASQTEFTARQVADAMGFMGMAGMSTNQIFDATPAVLQLASAGMVDVASAADTVTNIMAGYGLEAKDLEETNNILVATFTNSNTSLQGLGETFKYAGSVAKIAGLSLKQTAAMIGLMGNAGHQASVAGTALRSTLLRLQGNLPKVRRVVEKYGLEIKDSSGKMRDFSEIFRQLGPVVKNASDAQDLFGTYAVAAMSAAVEQGTGALDKMIGKIEGAGNIAERISSAQLQTLDGRIKIMQSNFEGLQISIGKALGPATVKIVDNLSIVLGDLRDAVDGVGVGLLDSESWASAFTTIKNFVLALAAAIDTIAQGVIKIVMFPITLITRAIAEAEFFVGTMMKAFKNIPGMRGVYEAGVGMREEGKSRRENLQQLMSDISSTKPLEDTLRSFFSMFESTAKSLIKSSGAGDGAGGGGGDGDGDTAVFQAPNKDELRAAYLREIAPTNFEAMMDGVTAALAKIGYKPAIAQRLGIAAPGGLGDVMQPLIKSTEELARQQADAAEAAAALSHKFDKAGEAVTRIGGAIVSGQAGSTFGPELGAMAGAAIAGAISGGTATGLGSAIGGIVGELLGDALDELIKALGVLTPVFDFVADVIGTLEKPLIVMREMVSSVATMLFKAFGPTLEGMANVTAKALYGVMILFQALAPILGTLTHLILELTLGAIVPVMDIITSAGIQLAEKALIPLARVVLQGYNAFVGFINGITFFLRNLEIGGVKPFKDFGVELDSVSTHVQTYADLMREETEAREESTQSLREFNEELTNVPTGIKRFRAFQFDAMRGSGRGTPFGQSAFGV
jgi:TP901 family phage tail tape measure protein